jgi:ApeA N-terminal domain 1/Apea-like HEPN
MEPIDVMGYFWLPDRPAERVPGRLTFSTVEGGSLSLIGELAGMETRLSRVLGEAEGVGYTLEDCLIALRSRGQGKQVLRVQRLVVGAFYGKDEPIEADRVSVQLANLPYWARSAGFDDALRPDREEHGGRWVISSSPIEPFSVPIGQGTLRLEQTRGSGGDGTTSLTLTQGAQFHAEFNEVLPLAEVVDLASDLQDLVSIGTDRSAAFERFALWHPTFSVERGGRPRRQPIEYFAEWNAQPDQKKHPPTEYSMAFTFAELGGMDGVASWLAVASKYRTMLSYVMNTRYERRMFVQDRLLDRVAALEGFHRAWKAGRKSLMTRLKELADLAGHPFEELVGDVSGWCRRAKDERNNVAHHKGSSVHQSGSDVLFTAEAAYWLFVLCILRVMQAPSAAFDHIIRCLGFEWVKEGLRGTA